MPPIDPKTAAELNIKSSRNVEQLRDECSRLAQNNDKLVNVIAQNNASKQTIIDLKKRLAYAQKNQGDKLVNFDEVNKNLDDRLREAKIKAAAQEKLKDQKLKESKELQSRKSDLKSEQKKLEDELKNLEAGLNMKTTEATRVASKKIILEEEIDDLQEKILFERHHFDLMEQALRLDDSQQASKASSQQDYQEFIDTLLRDYAQQFGDEYEKLMKKAQIREKALLMTKKEKLDETIAAKKVEKDELQKKLNDLGQEIHENEKKLNVLKEELAKLEAQKHQEHDEYLKQKTIKDAEAHRLQKENEKLKENIELTQKSANEALKVIIELEFEIKTYEKLLRIEDPNNQTLNSTANMSHSLDDAASLSKDQSDATMTKSEPHYVDVPTSELSGQLPSVRRSGSSTSSSTSSGSSSSQRR